MRGPRSDVLNRPNVPRASPIGQPQERGAASRARSHPPQGPPAGQILSQATVIAVNVRELNDVRRGPRKPLTLCGGQTSRDRA